MSDELNQDTIAKNRVKAGNNTLPVLIARAGGSVTVTRREFEEVAAMYGGTARMAIRMERLDASDALESGVRLTLIRKEPRQGELPV
jgi:hypothetical protein